MNILVIGGSGFVGFNLSSKLKSKNYKIHFTYNKNKLSNGLFLDITDREKTLDLIKKINPELVINTVALPGVDFSEANRELAYSINVNGMKNIIEACKKNNSKIIYISTSYVFDGTKKIFSEQDTPNPTNYYGETKLKAEKLVIESGLKYLIFRIDQAYGWTKKWQRENSVIRVIKTIKANKKLYEISDWYNNPTYIDDIIIAVDELIKKEEIGIYHIVGSNYISRYEWALKVAEIFNLNKDLIQPIQSESLGLVKRNNVNLSNEKFFNFTGIKIEGVKDGLLKMKEEENI